MKLLFIADIHGNATALQNALNLSGNLNPDQIILLGDLLNHGPRNPVTKGYNPQAVAEIINSHANDIICVRGNCDSEVDQMLIDVPVLADYALIFDGSRRFYLTHGHMHSPQNLPQLREGDIFCSGHTHIFQLQNQDGITLFNPGSITLPKGGHPPSFGWLDGDNLRVLDLNGRTLNALDLGH